MTSKRTITATNESGFNAKALKVVIFTRLDFSSGVKRFHTEIGPITATSPIHGSEVYDGLGDFGGIVGDVKETVSGAPASMVLALTGVDASLINTAFTDDYFRREAQLMIGLEDETGALIDDPTVLFDGYMDKIDISFVKNDGSIQLTLESRATNLLSNSDLRFTDEELQADYPGDTFAEYVYLMFDLVLRWGAQGVWSGIRRNGPGGGNNDGNGPRRHGR